MISPGTFTIRCDGTDPSTRDRCKSSTVVVVPIADLATLPADAGPARCAAFFGARLTGPWQVTAVGKIFCPGCK